MPSSARLRALSLLAINALSAHVALGQPARTHTADVGLRAVTPAGSDLKTLSGEVVARSLTLEDVLVKRGDDIKSLLRSNNIRPDAQALAYTAQLNPAVTHLDNLSVGDRLVLPSVSRASLALSGAALSTRIAIVTAPAEKLELAQSVSDLNAKLDAIEEHDVAPHVVASLRSATKALARPELIASAPPVAIHNLADNVAATVALVSAIKPGVPETDAAKAIETSAERLSTSVTTLSACRESGASCMAELIVVPLDVSTRKRIADVKLFYTPVLWRAIKNCAPPFGDPCRHDFYTNAPAYKVGLSQDGSFVVWAMRGVQVVSCDLQIDPPITSGERTIDVYATVADRDAMCTPARVGVRPNPDLH